MAKRAVTYVPEQVVIYLGGVLAEGFADGEFCTVEQMSPAFNDVVGTDGEVARSPSGDRRLKVIVKLLQTSQTNKRYSALLNTDLNAPNGNGVGSFLMQDLSGATIARGDQAWLVSQPNNSMDRTAKAREWEIRVAVGERTEGGN
jgi:hypothetical protein